MAQWKTLRTSTGASVSIDEIWIYRYNYSACLTLLYLSGTWEVIDSWLIRNNRLSGITNTDRNHFGTPAAHRKLKTEIAARVIEHLNKATPVSG